MKEETEDYIFEVLLGTYEEYLIGYKFFLKDDKYKLIQTIANHSHRGSLRAVAASGNLLASGASDENVHLYNLRERKECGILMHHTGTVTCLSFTPDNAFLITGGEDGSIAMLRVGNWVIEKLWSKAHKGQAVSGLSVHPSGKIALSVGEDKTLRTWNLIKGRPAYTINLSNKYKRPEFLSWSICGEYFGLVNENILDIYLVEKALIERSITIKERITCFQFNKDFVILGDWLGSIFCYDFKTSQLKWDILAGEEKNRVKALSVYEDWFVVANSNGRISIYNWPNDGQPKKIKEVESSCRITCMTISRPGSEKKRPKKKKKERTGDQNQKRVFSSSSMKGWEVTEINDE